VGYVVGWHRLNAAIPDPTLFRPSHASQDMKCNDGADVLVRANLLGQHSETFISSLKKVITAACYSV